MLPRKQLPEAIFPNSLANQKSTKHLSSFAKPIVQIQSLVR